MKLFGKTWKKREIEAYVGKIDQVGGIRRYKCMEGKEAESELIHVRTGAGLTYTISPSRGFDIVFAEYGGTPISWTSQNGMSHPSYFQNKGTNWLKTAVGGLLMTCGLTQVGNPCRDGEEELGLHGAIHHTSAKYISTKAEWVNDEYVLTASGEIEETTIFGHHLQLTREISSFIGRNKIYIKDTVENKGFEPAPHMILYHFNFGFPLMDEKTVVNVPSRQVRPRDNDVSLDEYLSWEAPKLGIMEKVYYHEDLVKDDNKMTKVTITNPEFPSLTKKAPTTLSLSWRIDTLPKFVQWKMNGKGMNVLGIEPSNCYVEGRVKEKEYGTLRFIQPGEKLDYHLELEIEG
jgi:hypothetical protein